MQSDERLSKLFSRGVEPAFDELARRYRESLVAFASGIVGRDRAEDVVQDSLVKAHRSMGKDEIRQPRAWLYRVVRNTALNEIRDGARHDHDELGDQAGDPLGNPSASEAERREELALLIAALAELPATQRTALVGRELGGYSHDELATRLGVSTGAAKQLVFRARTTLRNALGALMPLPLIAWLASDGAPTLLAGGTGAAASSAATGIQGAASGSGGGILAGLASASAAKVAVVAVVAGGSVAAGVAIEDGPRPGLTDTQTVAVRDQAQAAAGSPGLGAGARLDYRGLTGREDSGEGRQLDTATAKTDRTRSEVAAEVEGPASSEGLPSTGTRPATSPGSDPPGKGNVPDSAASGGPAQANPARPTSGRPSAPGKPEGALGNSGRPSQSVSTGNDFAKPSVAGGQGKIRPEKPSHPRR